LFGFIFNPEFTLVDSAIAAHSRAAGMAGFHGCFLPVAPGKAQLKQFRNSLSLRDLANAAMVPVLAFWKVFNS
jgi:hypothetical protein